MDFRPTDEQRLLRRTIRDLVEREIRPRAAEWDRSGELPWDNIRRLAAIGITGLTIPAAYGGGGQTLLEGVIAIEEIARGCPNTALALISGTGVVSLALAEYGTEAQKQRYLPPDRGGHRGVGHLHDRAHRRLGDLAGPDERAPRRRRLGGLRPEVHDQPRGTGRLLPRPHPLRRAARAGGGRRGDPRAQHAGPLVRQAGGHAGLPRRARHRHGHGGVPPPSRGGARRPRRVPQDDERVQRPALPERGHLARHRPGRRRGSARLRADARAVRAPRLPTSRGSAGSSPT